MSSLLASVKVRQTDVRSVNLERDLGSAAPIHGYAPPPQALHALRRVLTATGPTPATRAWSLTGPYGSGKSSFAHFLVALLGPASSPTHQVALDRLASVDSALASRLTEARVMLKQAQSGMLPAVAVAEREPVSRTIFRALLNGLTVERQGKRGARSTALKLALEIKDRDSVEPGAVLELLNALSSKQRPLIVIDELGKCLEFATDQSREGDLFLLQQIAEKFSGEGPMRGALVGLQHLAFEDYGAGLSAQRRREWRKVQGRFEDVPFATQQDHGVGLIAATLDHSDADRQTKAAISRRMREELERLEASGAALDLPTSFRAHPERCYPLHPLTVAALPLLAEHLGQHDRSLVAFLAGSSPHGLRDFLSSSGGAELLTLDRLYGFFVEGASTAAGSIDGGARLREISARVSEASHLEPLALSALRTVAILNLVSGHRGLRASQAFVRNALAPLASEEATDQALTGLQNSGLITYRRFADEFRIWRGSDFDVAGAVARERERLSDGTGLATLDLEQLEMARPARPLVARRHTQQTGTLRYFEAQYAQTPPLESPTCRRPDSDGLLLYVFTAFSPTENYPRVTVDGKPLLMIFTSHLREVAEAALDAAASAEVLRSDHALTEDPVARAEVRHRVSQAQAALEDRLAVSFAPGTPGVEIVVSGKPRPIQGTRELAGLLSELCDATFPATPRIPNEMLNRRELTSQGAKTRRLLIEAMIERGDAERLGFTGWGPERSMYEAVLASTGLHDARRRHPFDRPATGSGLEGAWKAIETFISEASSTSKAVSELYSELMEPPLGMKDGPIPVLLTAVLLRHRNSVFLYQDSTFVPSLSADVMERMVKTPERFLLKSVRVDGIREELFEALVHELIVPEDGTRSGELTTLSLVRPLIALVRGLPPFVLQTQRLSDQAGAVLLALRTAREPDELLYSELPKACGVDVSAGDASEAPLRFVEQLRVALGELKNAYPSLLRDCEAMVADAFRLEMSGPELREALRHRAAPLADRVIDRQMRPFVLMACDEQLEAEEWLEALLMNLSGKPPKSWSDQDLGVFEAELSDRARRFKQLELLHSDAATARPGREPRRLTLTTKDGQETSGLLWLDPELVGTMASELDAILDRANATTSDSSQALLVALADRLLRDDDSPVRLVPVEKAS